MKIKLLEKKDNEIKFLIKGITPQFTNALRRIIMKEVPVLAIDTVDFYHNDSILFNEMIAHRLCLIPLTFPKEMNLPDECKCEGKGCSLCQVVLVLDKKGPCMVYAKDLKSTDKNVQPVFPDMPIVELFDNQKLKLEATAILGIGKNHAKWQAGIAYYKYYPVLEKSPTKNLEKYVEICPKNALSIEKNKLVLNDKCDICKECFKLGNIKIVGDENKFIFTVETVSGLKPEELVLKAIDILEKKLKEFEKQIKKVQ